MSTGLTSGQCPACGAAISSGDRACPACGLDLVTDELAKIAYTTRFLEWARKYWLLDEQAHARLQRELDKAHSALTGAAWQPAAAPTPAAQPPAPAHAAWPTAPTAGVQPTQPASPAAPPKAQPLAGRTAPARAAAPGMGAGRLGPRPPRARLPRRAADVHRHPRPGAVFPALGQHQPAPAGRGVRAAGPAGLLLVPPAAGRAAGRRQPGVARRGRAARPDVRVAAGWVGRPARPAAWAPAGRRAGRDRGRACRGLRAGCAPAPGDH